MDFLLFFDFSVRMIVCKIVDFRKKVLYSLNRIKRLTVLQLYAIWKAIEQKWENLI